MRLRSQRLRDALDSLQATILTPNRYEAQLLSGLEITTTLVDMEKAAAQRIHASRRAALSLVKGGGMPGTLYQGC